MYTPNLVSILFCGQPLSIFKFDDVMPTSRMAFRFFASYGGGGGGGGGGEGEESFSMWTQRSRLSLLY